MRSLPSRIAIMVTLLGHTACGDREGFANDTQPTAADAAVAPSTGTDDCTIGGERCPCYPNETCDEGLSCVSAVCVDLSPSNGDGGEGASSDQTSSEEAGCSGPSERMCGHVDRANRDAGVGPNIDVTPTLSQSDAGCASGGACGPVDTSEQGTAEPGPNVFDSGMTTSSSTAVLDSGAGETEFGSDEDDSVSTPDGDASTGSGGSDGDPKPCTLGTSVLPCVLQ